MNQDKYQHYVAYNNILSAVTNEQIVKVIVEGDTAWPLVKIEDRRRNGFDVENCRMFRSGVDKDGLAAKAKRYICEEYGYEILSGPAEGDESILGVAMIPEAVKSKQEVYKNPYDSRMETVYTDKYFDAGEWVISKKKKKRVKE